MSKLWVLARLRAEGGTERRPLRNLEGNQSQSPDNDLERAREREENFPRGHSGEGATISPSWRRGSTRWTARDVVIAGLCLQATKRLPSRFVV